jgi:hypothetical protein
MYIAPIAVIDLKNSLDEIDHLNRYVKEFEGTYVLITLMMIDNEGDVDDFITVEDDDYDDDAKIAFYF